MNNNSGNLEEMCSTFSGINPTKEGVTHWSMLTLKKQALEEELNAHARAYILGLIGWVLMPDKIGNKVYLMYLQFLVNLC